MSYINICDDNQMILNNEHSLQTEIVKFLKKTDLIYAANCNGFLDTPLKRKQAWEEGMSSGHPDLLIYTPNKKYNGFALEFKTPNGMGNLADNQKKWLNDLERCNYFSLCSNSLTEVIECLVKYMNDILH